MFNIAFYEKEDGTRPAEEFINSLDIAMKAKTLRTISLLKDYGNELREPYSKSLGDGIFELRTQVKNDITRVLYFFIVGKNIILTNGFVKKTQKTPQKEIDLAKKYRKNYIDNEEK